MFQSEVKKKSKISTVDKRRESFNRKLTASNNIKSGLSEPQKQRRDLLRVRQTVSKEILSLKLHKNINRCKITKKTYFLD